MKPMGGGWEVRPGGMLVQKRNSDANLNTNNIRVKVKYGSSYHEVIISSQATFGELKKIVAGRTGLHREDQKLVFKDKERDSRDFLDFCGVKDGSKVVVIEDELRRERRCIESRKNAMMEKASNDIAAIRLEVDSLVKQVASAQLEINSGNKVVETILLNLIEELMTQLIKLDAIAADGNVKLQRRMQVTRVQKYIETLDMLKIRNSGLGKMPSQQHRVYVTRAMEKTCQSQQEQWKHGNFKDRVDAGQVVVTTKWETF